MGRESRQARRAKERRLQQQQRRHQPTSKAVQYSLWVSAAIVAIVAVILGVMAVHGSGVSASATPTPLADIASQTVDGIGCNFGGEVTTYHEHGHLTIMDHGKSVPIPPNIGRNVDHDCLYWIHTHMPSLGVLHVEAPNKIEPPLRDFFTIWKKPLSATKIGPVTVQPGDKVKLWVNLKPYNGDLGSIPIKRHTQIWIDVGPPFPQPKPFNFAKYQL
ncbi:MAG TPA: hypothetical protein VF898_01095 [Chloroflexota bacterium]